MTEHTATISCPLDGEGMRMAWSDALSNGSYRSWPLVGKFKGGILFHLPQNLNIIEGENVKNLDLCTIQHIQNAL